ncbi:MAG: hypothetical protein ACI4L9_05215 [Candidatus Coproplasma sp.]
MRINKKLSCFLSVLLAAAVVWLCGCYDLGEFEDDEDYYSSFGEVRLFESDKTTADYSVKEYFYNEKSINDFSGGQVGDDEYYIVGPDWYTYLVVDFQRNMQLDSFSLFVNCANAGALHISAYLAEGYPSDVRGYDDSRFELDEDNNPVLDEEGNPKEIRYGDPDPESAVWRSSLNVGAGKWTSFTIETWFLGGTTQEYLSVTSENYLIIRFENNGGYGADNAYQQIEFTTTNMLVRAKFN